MAGAVSITFSITPSRETAAILWEAISANGPSKSPRLTPRITGSHCDMTHPGGGTECSYLYVICSLEHHDIHDWIPSREELLITTTGPPETDQTFLQDHLFNRTASIIPIRLLPPPWSAGCRLYSDFVGINQCFYAVALIFPIKV